MIDIKGFALDDHEKSLIKHPLVGGIILFTRNFQDISQVKSLIMSCQAIKSDLIVAIDHEGGRVQRFKSGFTHLPAMAQLGDLYDRKPDQACDLAYHTAIVLAYELKKIGVNLSFTPVLDLNYGHSEVIGNRSFHQNPAVVSILNQFFIKGLHDCGFPAIGKHFPGHGYVNADSHLTLPVDERDEETIINNDVLPYKALILSGLDAVMPAHVVYKNVDDKPAGFSRYWLQHILRSQLGFNGVIFSDDLAMEGAVQTGSPTDRALAAFHAGCDMVLLCNKPEEIDPLLNGLDQFKVDQQSIIRLNTMMAVSQNAISESLYIKSLKELENWK
ncbi:MAG: beta-N-acetylhexosaminidase [Betaproteobacteria bacterium]|nr:beta-N-acetylhexosaminidase [Betaproteobacteria bacterium]MDE2423630.1 beta-N-acetylhexosaminidase [Betaproteobacteria bacterium]